MLFPFQAYVQHWLFELDEHSLHSPFLFSFYNDYVKAKSPSIAPIESIRENLQKSQDAIALSGYGSGSQLRPSRSNQIKHITKHGISSKKKSLLLRRLVHYFKQPRVLELGTSVGINAAYMAYNTAATVYTFEGEPELAKWATQNFQQLHLQNINLIEGRIQQTLPEFLLEAKPIDLAFIDADHCFASTVQFFQWIQLKTHPHSILVLDDIHLTRDMQQSWDYISSHKSVTLAIDLFHVGIIFLHPELPRQRFKLAF